MPPKSSAIDAPQTTLVAAPAGAAAEVPNPPVIDIAEKLRVIAEENKAACAELQAYFGSERWTALMKQAAQRRHTPEDVERLSGNMRRSRREWEMAQGNDKAALILAANGFLVGIGSAPSKADEKALEDALNAAPAAA